MSEKSFDIDDMIYTPFYCVDCGLQFQTREDLVEHWVSLLIATNIRLKHANAIGGRLIPRLNFIR